MKETFGAAVHNQLLEYLPVKRLGNGLPLQLRIGDPLQGAKEFPARRNDLHLDPQGGK